MIFKPKPFYDFIIFSFLLLLTILKHSESRIWPHTQLLAISRGTPHMGGCSCGATVVDTRDGWTAAPQVILDNPTAFSSKQHPALCCDHRPQHIEENAELGICRKTSEHLSGALSIHRGEDTNTCSKPAPEPATLIYETEKLHSVAARGTQAPVLAGHLTVSAAFCRSEMAFVTRDQVLGSNAASYDHLTP